MHTDAPTTFRPPPAEAWRDPLALLLASTGEGIYGVDLDGGCVFINPAGARLIGYEPEELIGLNMHDLTHHSRPDGSAYPEAECPIFNAFRQGLPCRIDSEVFWHRNGAPLPVEYSSYPILDGTRVLGAVITFVDITERRRAAEALQRAKDELELRVRERTLELQNALQQTREPRLAAQRIQHGVIACVDQSSVTDRTRLLERGWSGAMACKRTRKIGRRQCKRLGAWNGVRAMKACHRMFGGVEGNRLLGMRNGRTQEHAGRQRLLEKGAFHQRLSTKATSARRSASVNRSTCCLLCSASPPCHSTASSTPSARPSCNSRM